MDRKLLPLLLIGLLALSVVGTPLGAGGGKSKMRGKRIESLSKNPPMQTALVETQGLPNWVVKNGEVYTISTDHYEAVLNASAGVVKSLTTGGGEDMVPSTFRSIGLTEGANPDPQTRGSRISLYDHPSETHVLHSSPRKFSIVVNATVNGVYFENKYTFWRILPTFRLERVMREESNGVTWRNQWQGVDFVEGYDSNGAELADSTIGTAGGALPSKEGTVSFPLERYPWIHFDFGEDGTLGMVYTNASGLGNIHAYSGTPPRTQSFYEAQTCVWGAGTNTNNIITRKDKKSNVVTHYIVGKSKEFTKEFAQDSYSISQSERFHTTEEYLTWKGENLKYQETGNSSAFVSPYYSLRQNLDDSNTTAQPLRLDRDRTTLSWLPSATPLVDSNNTQPAGVARRWTDIMDVLSNSTDSLYWKGITPTLNSNLSLTHTGTAGAVKFNNTYYGWRDSDKLMVNLSAHDTGTSVTAEDLYTVLDFDFSLAEKFGSGYVDYPHISWYDGFEDENFNPYWNDLANYTTTSSVVAKGSTAVRGVASSGNSRYIDTASRVANMSSDHGISRITWTTNFTGRYIGLWVRTNNTNDRARFTVYDRDPSYADAKRLTIVGIIEGGIKYYNGSYVKVADAKNDTWYHIELRNMNFTSHTYDMWVNGTEVAEDCHFEDNGKRVAAYSLTTADKGVANTAAGYFDDVQFGREHLQVEKVANGYDIRFKDPNLGWIGAYVNASNAVHRKGKLLIPLLNQSSDTTLSPPFNYSKQIMIWHHKGKVTSKGNVTGLHTREPLFWKLPKHKYFSFPTERGGVIRDDNMDKFMEFRGSEQDPTYSIGEWSYQTRRPGKIGSFNLSSQVDQTVTVKGKTNFPNSQVSIESDTGQTWKVETDGNGWFSFKYGDDPDEEWSPHQFSVYGGNVIIQMFSPSQARYPSNYPVKMNAKFQSDYVQAEMDWTTKVTIWNEQQTVKHGSVEKTLSLRGETRASYELGVFDKGTYTVTLKVINPDVGTVMATAEATVRVAGKRAPTFPWWGYLLVAVLIATVITVAYIAYRKSRK